MRNLKRVLSLVLAAMMLIGMMVIGASAASTAEGGFSSNLGDYDAINQDYQEAVSVIEGLDIIQGYEDGDYHPTDILQRDQAAKIIAYMLLGEKKAEDLNPNTTHFADVPAGYWAAGYIDYCVTKGILAGYGDGTFGPHDKLTGYQFGKMLLVALGYDAELEGYANDDNYITNISVDMIENDIYVDDVLIVDPVSREVAAQMAFNTLGAVEVDYTYQHFVQVATPVTGNITLGEDVFGLDSTIKANDIWGRPARVWTADTKKAAPKGTVATYVYPLAAESDDLYSECDVYADAGMTGKSVTIRAFYEDGESKDTETASTSGVASIVDTNTNKYIGATGRHTEVYVVDGSAWIVEINTYLAQVTKVVAKSTDARGHESPAYVEMSVYVDRGQDVKDKGAEVLNGQVFYTDALAKGDFVLVAMNRVDSGKDDANGKDIYQWSKVQTAEKAPVVAYGELTDYTATTTTVDDTKYTDADKFVRIDDEYLKDAPTGYANKASNADYYAKQAAWGADRAVIEDAHGNIIGLVNDVPSYMVVERIEWKHSGDKIGEGYALADILLPDGTELEGVRVSSISGGNGDDYDEANNISDGTADMTKGQLSDDYKNNGEYYGHVFSYSLTDDNTYRIKHVGEDYKPDTNKYATITNGVARFDDNASSPNYFTADDETIFLVWNGKTHSYDRYVGIDSVPTMRRITKLCVFNDDNDVYVDLVVVEVAGNVVDGVYLILDKDPDPSRGFWTAYKLGETKATRVYANEASTNSKTAAVTSAIVGPGLYEITMDDAGRVQDVSSAVGVKLIEAGYSATDATLYGTHKLTEDADVLTALMYVDNAEGANSVVAFGEDGTDGSKNSILKNGSTSATMGVTYNSKKDAGYEVKYGTSDIKVNASITDKNEVGRFRLNNAKMLTINLEAAYDGTDTAALTGKQSLSGASAITDDCMVLLVYTELPSGEFETLYGYVYKGKLTDSKPTTPSEPKVEKLDVIAKAGEVKFTNSSHELELKFTLTDKDSAMVVTDQSKYDISGTLEGQANGSGDWITVATFKGLKPSSAVSSASEVTITDATVYAGTLTNTMNYRVTYTVKADGKLCASFTCPVILDTTS